MSAAAAPPATEGEAWVRRELQELLAARLHPVAVGRFFWRSQVRANGIRRSQPALARREAAWAASGAGAWLGLAAAGVPPFRGAVRSGLGGWGATVVMLDWHLGMVETEDGRPRNLGPADAATLLRAWLIPAVARRPTVLLCAVGYATDVLDGRLARASEPTRLGRDLEGLVDASFTIATLRGARRTGALTRTTTAAETARLVAGIAYAVASYFGRAQPPDAALLRAGRLIGPARAAGLLLALAGRRRSGEALLVAGSAASLAALARLAGAPAQAAG